MKYELWHADYPSGRYARTLIQSELVAENGAAYYFVPGHSELRLVTADITIECDDGEHYLADYYTEH